MPSKLQLRLAKREANNRQLDALLRSSPDVRELYRREWANTAFERLPVRCRRVLAPRLWPVMLRALGFRRHFVRDPQSWRARGRSREAVGRSLVRHLLCAYPVPQWWSELWVRPEFVLERFGPGVREVDPFDRDEARLFIAVAQGASFRGLVNTGELPVPLTRRGCHRLREQFGVQGLVHAVRKTQLDLHEAPRPLVAAVLDSTWGDAFDRRLERRRAAVLPWLCGAGPLTPTQVQWLLHYFDHQQPRLRGRAAAHVLRAVTAWFEAGQAPPIHRPYRVDDVVSRGWGRSGWLPWQQGDHAIFELRTHAELVAEGRALRHCVATYVHAASVGSASLWSYRVDGVRRLTIEVRNQAGAVVQIKGRNNRPPTSAELEAVTAWAGVNGLRIGP